jgi:hypothetical protein
VLLGAALAMAREAGWLYRIACAAMQASAALRAWRRAASGKWIDGREARFEREQHRHFILPEVLGGLLPLHIRPGFDLRIHGGFSFPQDEFETIFLAFQMHQFALRLRQLPAQPAVTEDEGPQDKGGQDEGEQEQ